MVVVGDEAEDRGGLVFVVDLAFWSEGNAPAAPMNRGSWCAWHRDGLETKLVPWGLKTPIVPP